MKILKGDCLKSMKDIPDNSIDAIITSSSGFDIPCLPLDTKNKDNEIEKLLRELSSDIKKLYGQEWFWIG